MVIFKVNSMRIGFSVAINAHRKKKLLFLSELPMCNEIHQ